MKPQPNESKQEIIIIKKCTIGQRQCQLDIHVNILTNTPQPQTFARSKQLFVGLETRTNAELCTIWDAILGIQSKGSLRVGIVIQLENCGQAQVKQLIKWAKSILCQHDQYVHDVLARQLMGSSPDKQHVCKYAVILQTVGQLHFICTIKFLMLKYGY